MKQITKNFSLREIQHSDTAERAGLVNTVPIDAYEPMIKLYKLTMQPLRDVVGKITLNSAYRCLKLNEILRGSAFSQHMYSNQRGAACDFVHASRKLSTVDLINKMLELELPFDQIILEHPFSYNGGWVHVSTSGVSSNNRFKMLVKQYGKPYIEVNPFKENVWGIFIK